MSTIINNPVVYHTDSPSWRTTPDGASRGYIQPQLLQELWFHTGSICNLECPFCLEGSKPGDNRIEQVTFDEVRPYMDEALDLGVHQFSFTGGEPFVNKDLLRMLDYALVYRPCMVLTNGTQPLRKRLNQLLDLLKKPHALKLRISLDYPDPARHDAGRGAGNFRMALRTLGTLHKHGFAVSIARLAQKKEDAEAINSEYVPFLQEVGVTENLHFVAFPDFGGPGCHPAGVPHITENCMTTYHTAQSRARFMCSFSKMIVKKAGKLGVYACTLVDDNETYNLGPNLRESLKYRIMLQHHRCFACFAHGASCSETGCGS